MTSVLIKRRNLDTETHIKESGCEEAKGKTVIYNTRGKAWNRSFPHSPQKEPTPPTPWYQISNLQRTGSKNICVVQASQSVVLCSESSSKLICMVTSLGLHNLTESLATRYTKIVSSLSKLFPLEPILVLFVPLLSFHLLTENFSK